MQHVNWRHDMISATLVKCIKNLAMFRFSFCCLGPWLAWLWWWSPDRKCHDQVTDHELVAHNVTKHVMVAPTVWASPLIITIELVTLTWFCFSRNLSWLCQWHFAQLIAVKKKSWHSDWPSDGCKNVMKNALITPVVLSITSDYHNGARDANMHFVSARFFHYIDIHDCVSDILRHWSQ